jgi:hypothetical protein
VSFQYSSAAFDPAAAERRLEELEQVLYALRRLRAEVESVRPGLVLDRVAGWHSGAAELYAERAFEVRYALAGAERSLEDAELELTSERYRLHAAAADDAARAPVTPHHPVPRSRGGR